MALKNIVRETAEKRWSSVGRSYCNQDAHSSASAEHRFFFAASLPCYLRDRRDRNFDNISLATSIPEAKVTASAGYTTRDAKLCHRYDIHGDAFEAQYLGRTSERGECLIESQLLPRTKFLSDDDEIMLEDESGRVRLVGQIMEDRKYPLVTGTSSFPSYHTIL
jgi:hypothetical protein